jgi:VWFA-related protein
MSINTGLTRRSLLAALGIAPFLRGQQQTPPPPVESAPGTTFSTNVKVVNVLANVRNKKGEIVRDLTKDEFLLDEDGRPQTIKYFSQESDLPLTLGLLVDTSGSQRRLIGEERDASSRFFDQVLRPEKDVAFVIHFDFEVELLQDVTSSRKLLQDALDQLESPVQLQRRQPGQGRQGGGGYPGGGGGYPGGGGGYPGGSGQRRGGRGGGTDLYDSVLLGSDEIMKKQAGRKALIILSDGVDTGSKVTLTSCIESAQRADTIVYSILFEDPEAYGNGGNMGGFGGRGRRGGMGRMPVPTGAGHPDGKKVLEQISRETGGRLFKVSKKDPLSKAFAEINDELRHQYSIGYTSDATDNRGFRHIHLATKQKGLSVTTREGYYPA